MREHHFYADEIDYPLQRVLNMVATGSTCSHAWIELISGNELHPVASNRDHTIPWPNPLGLAQQVAESHQALVYERMGDAADPQLSDYSRATQLGAFGCFPLYTSDMQPFGTLSVGHKRPRRFTRARRQLISDGVRLIEDILALRADSIRDPLTGCFNRRYFDQQLDVEFRRTSRLQLPMTVALIDVDHFKRFNDSAGHAAGDDALRAIGNVLRQHMKRAGDVVCRIGGEEFAVVLAGTDAKDAERLLRRCADAVRLLGIENPGCEARPITVSIGFSTLLDVAQSPDGALQIHMDAADQALYSAKRRGRDLVVYASG